VLPEVKMMYIKVEGGTIGTFESTCESNRLANVSAPTTNSFPSGIIDVDRSCCLQDESMALALTCSAMFWRRARGSVGSISTMVAPAFITARTATIVHLDFSKHTGRKSFNSTPDSLSEQARNVEYRSI
jgi:hypothetical protein